MSAALNSRGLLGSTDLQAFQETITDTQTARNTQRPTFRREYKASSESDKLRQKILETITQQFNGEGIKSISENCSFIPLRQSNGLNFTPLSTTKEDGALFLTAIKLSEALGTITSLGYIIRILKQQLEATSGLSAEELEKQFRAYGKDYLLHHYFEPVDRPQDGDLVIYSDMSTPHYGIYKENTGNGATFNGGFVESKWSWWPSPYAFQHDIFFAPPQFGNVAEFFRMKRGRVNEDTLAMKPHKKDHQANRLSSNTTYTLQDDGSLIFNKTAENVARRKIIDNNIFRGVDLHPVIPELQRLCYINFSGICQDYAFGRVLSTYSFPAGMAHPSYHGHQILALYFTITISPQKGDLIVYERSDYITHWGVYRGDGIVESKWGVCPVYRHPLFDVPSGYGKTIKCYRLNDGLTIDELAASLKSFRP